MENLSIDLAKFNPELDGFEVEDVLLQTGPDGQMWAAKNQLLSEFKYDAELQDVLECALEKDMGECTLEPSPNSKTDTSFKVTSDQGVEGQIHFIGNRMVVDLPRLEDKEYFIGAVLAAAPAAIKLYQSLTKKKKKKRTQPQQTTGETVEPVVKQRKTPPQKFDVMGLLQAVLPYAKPLLGKKYGALLPLIESFIASRTDEYKDQLYDEFVRGLEDKDDIEEDSFDV